ncbi:hypothetical protein EV129_101539 [Rhizobium azibense]|uniref:Uncharacterized protein n=1 Tax=Rhizobium azibense TaxID=1136135 RepID=A0A4R3S3J1_9HYPH|nr:hypothetical protein EV129_101539 [Rhizobium azibense]
MTAASGRTAITKLDCRSGGGKPACLSGSGYERCEFAAFKCTRCDLAKCKLDRIEICNVDPGPASACKRADACGSCQCQPEPVRKPYLTVEDDIRVNGSTSRDRAANLLEHKERVLDLVEA